MKEFKVYITQNYQPITVSAETQEEAEKYLDNLWPKYKLEQWCLAMLMNYGLRNHELHWVSNITEENKEEVKGINQEKQ